MTCTKVGVRLLWSFITVVVVIAGFDSVGELTPNWFSGCSVPVTPR